MTRRVRAYHGTTLSAATQIHQHQRSFALSQKDGDWLGRGAYFFEENLIKAIEWALVQVTLRSHLHSFDSPAVLEVDLDLTHCLDLCSSAWHENLRNIALKLEGVGQAKQQDGPSFTTPGNRHSAGKTVWVADYRLTPTPGHSVDDHFADKAVIDALVADLTQAGEPVTSVRAAFALGDQPYCNSHFFSDTHIQIAVLDSAIVTTRRVIHPVPLPSSFQRLRQP